MSALKPLIQVVFLLGLSAILPQLPADTREEPTAPAVVQSNHRIRARTCVTWWANDATGYHPCLLVEIENDSGCDLSGQLIKFQGRFVDLRGGLVTVARRDLRQPFPSHHQLYVLLKGPLAFDLPIDAFEWPDIEYKVLARVGDAGLEEPQELAGGKLDAITMSDDDAMQKMSRISDFIASTPSKRTSNQGNKDSKHSTKDTTFTTSDKPDIPLVATAGKLQKNLQPFDKKASQAKSLLSYLVSKPIPGLGNDFYMFEKTFGLPTATNTEDHGWTWASYQHSEPAMNILTGSKGQSGKVDMIILELPDYQTKKETDIIGLAHALAGDLKVQKLGAPTHSVRYLPAGRIQIMTCAASSYHANYFIAPGKESTESRAYLIVCRLPLSIIEFLSEHSKKAKLVEPIAQSLASQ